MFSFELEGSGSGPCANEAEVRPAKRWSVHGPQNHHIKQGNVSEALFNIKYTWKAVNRLDLAQRYLGMRSLVESR